MSGFPRTHTDIRRDPKRFTDVQSAKTVRLATWLMDQRTIKISKAIPAACWQLVQLFAPVSPALHMRLEWIILPCARHISPFRAVTSSEEHGCGRPGSSLSTGIRRRKQPLCFWKWLWDVGLTRLSVELGSWYELTHIWTVLASSMNKGESSVISRGYLALAVQTALLNLLWD